MQLCEKFRANEKYIYAVLFKVLIKNFANQIETKKILFSINM